MNGWELTNVELAAIDASDIQTIQRKTAQAAQKKLVEWGNEECWEHEDKHRIALRKTMEELDTEKPYFPRHFCYKCWQALCKGVK